MYIQDQFIEEDTEVVDTEEIIAQDPVMEEEQEEQEQEQEKEDSTEKDVKEDQNAGGAQNDGVKKQTITFDDIDRVRIMNDAAESTEELVNAPKTLERLEEISMKNFARRKEEEEQDGYDDDEHENDALHIGDPVSLGDLDIDMFSEEL